MLQVGLIGWSKKPSITWTLVAAPIDEASSNPRFWRHDRALPDELQHLADRGIPITDGTSTVGGVVSQCREIIAARCTDAVQHLKR